MAMRFARKVRTASGAVAVQIVNRTGRTVTGIEHIGSAGELGVLLAKAEQELRPGQQASASATWNKSPFGPAMSPIGASLIRP